MLTNLLYLKIAITMVMMIVMLFEWRRFKSSKAQVLFLIFAVMFLKEIAFVIRLFSIPFADLLKGVEEFAPVKDNIINNLGKIFESSNEALLPVKASLDNLIMVWHFIEVFFCIILFHLVHLWVSLGEKGKFRKAFTIINTLLLGAAVFFVGKSGTYSSYKWIFTVWQSGLLFSGIILIGRIYKYTFLDLKYLIAHKLAISFAFVPFILFYFLNTITPFINKPFSMVFQITGIISLCVFSYKFMHFSLDSIRNKVVEIRKERSLVITLLQDIGHAMAENLSQGIVMERIINAALKSTDARTGCVLLIEERTNSLGVEVVTGFYPPVTKMDLGNLTKEKFLIEKFKSTRVKIGESYLGKVAETGESLFIRDAKDDDRIEQTAKGLMDIRTVITVPLKIQDDILGVMSIINKESAPVFSDADFSLMETLGDQAAITLNQVKLYQEMLEKKQSEKELSVAGNIQMALLPTEFKDYDKIDVSAFSHAAKGVGGDYYDLIDFGNGKVGIIMTDVAGKGVPAALIMVMIRSVLRTYAKEDREARDVITTVNNTIAGDVTEERYATMFYFIFDSEYKILNYCNAAHGPLLLYRSNLDSFALLDTEGMPVGILPDVEYGQEYTSLHSGDIAVLYTDGITEAMNLNREQFGLDRVKKIVRENKHLRAKELTDMIYEQVEEFVGAASQHDDQTLLLMKAK